MDNILANELNQKDTTTHTRTMTFGEPQLQKINLNQIDNTNTVATDRDA
jgi:hypothetical protein